MVYIAKLVFLLHARFISRWKYRFSSDQRSQATLSGVSTEVGDHSGTLRDLAFLPNLFLTFSLGLPPIPLQHLNVTFSHCHTQTETAASSMLISIDLEPSFGYLTKSRVLGFGPSVTLVL